MVFIDEYFCGPRNRIERMGPTILVYPSDDGVRVHTMQWVLLSAACIAGTRKEPQNPRLIHQRLDWIPPIICGPSCARTNPWTEQGVGLSRAGHQGDGQGRRQKKPQHVTFLRPQVYSEAAAVRALW